MTNEQKTIVKTYKKEIRRLFPIYGKNEKRFFEDIENVIDDYTADNESFSRETLIRDIGEPKDLISRYLLEMDADVLRKNLSRSRCIKNTAIAGLIAILFACAFKIAADYRSFIEGRDSYIHSFTVEITDYGS